MTTPQAYEYTTFPRQFVSYRWFKPLLVGLLTFAFMIFFQIVILIAATFWEGDINFLFSISTSYDDMNPYTGPGALAIIGGIAALLPALALAALIVGDRPFSSYSSSRGGWSWTAFVKCLALALVVVCLVTVVQLAFLPDESATGVVRFTVAGVVACIILVPLQCLAEEYVFRGLIMQAIGSWTKLPAVAIIVGAAVFTAGHPYNALGMITIFIDGIIWGVIVWKTSGLEACSAMHIVNNMVAIALGGMGLSPVTSEVTIESLVIDVSITLVYAAIVLVVGKKFNWFAPKGDGTVAFNEKKRAKLALAQTEHIMK